MRYRNEYLISETNDSGEMNSHFFQVDSAGYYFLKDDINEPPISVYRDYELNGYLFCHINNGGMSVYIGEKEYLIDDGGFFILPPNVIHHYGKFRCKESFALVWTHFIGSAAKEFLRQCMLDRMIVYNCGEVEGVNRLVENIVKEIALKLPGCETVVAAEQMRILSMVGRHVNPNFESLRASVDFRVARAMEYIQMNYQKHITVKKLALKAELSVSRFSALFNKYYGSFPHQYLLNLRIEKAQGLLRHTEFSVNKISELVGFEDSFYFSRVFKNKIGVRPSDYRNQKKTDGSSLDQT